MDQLGKHQVEGLTWELVRASFPNLPELVAKTGQGDKGKQKRCEVARCRCSISISISIIGIGIGIGEF